MSHDASVFPAHVREEPRNWWACTQPERPFDEYELFDTEHCRGCRLALRALVANGLGDTILSQGETGLDYTAHEILALLDKFEYDR